MEARRGYKKRATRVVIIARNNASLYETGR